MDLTPQDIEKAKFVFSIYDFDGKEKIDGTQLADCLRALDLTPTLKAISKLGGSTKKDEKKYSIEEFLAIFAEAKKDKDVGHLEDYLEVLKLFDKDGNGYMPGNQLTHMLSATGEILGNDQIQIIMKDCEEFLDDEGNLKYTPFMNRICTGPPSTFDDVSFSTDAAAPAASATVSVRKPSVRPSITVDDDTPSVSFAAAKPMVMPQISMTEPDEPGEEPPVASFTLKAPRKSISSQ